MPDPATTPAHEGGEREMDINKVSELERDLECEIASMIEDLPDDESASLCKAMIALRNGIAALAGTSADAGARETVTVWGRMTDAAAVLRTWESMGTEPFEGAHPYSVTITVTPGKERSLMTQDAGKIAYVTTSSATQGDVYMVVNGVFTCKCGTSHSRGPVDGVNLYRCLKCGNEFTFPTSPMTHDTNDACGGAVAMCPKGTPATDAQLIELRKWWDAFACENTPLAIHRMASEYIEAREALEMMRDVRVGLIAERDRLRAFVASLKAKAQQSIIILPRHFEAFERGETPP